MEGHFGKRKTGRTNQKDVVDSTSPISGSTGDAQLRRGLIGTEGKVERRNGLENEGKDDCALNVVDVRNTLGQAKKLG